MNTWMSFASWLKQHRNEMKYSQYQLADASGIARAYIGKMEKEGGVDLPTPPLREKLHKVFGTSDETLVDDGVAEWVTRIVGDGQEKTVLEAKPKLSPASDIGERAAIASILEGMPNDAVQHLRLFLEAVVKP